MQEFFKSIGFDIVSGLITSLLIFIFTIFLKFWFIPLIKRIKYNGSDISGQWHYQSIFENNSYVYTINIKQNAHNIKGSAQILKKHNEAIEYSQDFRITGLIYEGYVILNLRSTNNRVLSFSTGIFQIQNRGSLLNGALSYRVRIGDGIETENILFYRA